MKSIKTKIWYELLYHGRLAAEFNIPRASLETYWSLVPSIKNTMNAQVRDEIS